MTGSAKVTKKDGSVVKVSQPLQTVVVGRWLGYTSS